MLEILFITVVGGVIAGLVLMLIEPGWRIHVERLHRVDWSFARPYRRRVLKILFGTGFVELILFIIGLNMSGSPSWQGAFVVLFFGLPVFLCLTLCVVIVRFALEVRKRLSRLPKI